jgi:hypothetical protein
MAWCAPGRKYKSVRVQKYKVNRAVAGMAAKEDRHRKLLPAFALIAGLD